MYLEKFKSGKNTYIRLVECYRDPNTKTNRKKVIKNYGNYEKLKEQSPEVLRELEEKYSNVKAKETLARNDNFERLVNSLSAGVGDSEESLLLNYSSLILNPLWRDSLGMTEFFRYLKTRNDTEIQFDASKLTYYLAVQKMVEPQSHFHAYSSLSSYIGTGITELELSSLYRCLDYLYANKESILAHINRKVEGLYPRQNSLLFYDTTNCYFETPLDDEQTFTRYAKQAFCELLRDEGYEVAPDEVVALLEKEPSLIEIYEKCREEYGEAIRMRGLSKELRYDLPMVSVALVIDSNAFPVDFMVFAGNKSEKTNMVNSIDRLKSTYNITESIIVADSGLNSVPNMYMLLKNGFGYAISKSALSLPKKMEADITDLSKYTEKTDAQGNPLNYMYRIIDYPQKYKIIDEEHPENSPVTVVIKNRMLLTFSKKRQQHDLAVLEEKFGKARKAVADGDKIKTVNKGFSSFLSADIDTKKLIAKKIKMKLIEKHRKRAGFAAVIYHDVPTKEELTWLQSPKEETKPELGIVGRNGLDNVDMSNVYHHLVQIERCFRIMKSNFSIRPMFVRTEAHINAHVLICIISLIMLRLIQKKLEGKGIHLSENAICSGLNDASLSYTVRNNINVYEKLTVRRMEVSTTEKVNGYKMNVTDLLTEVIDRGKLNHYNSDEDLRKVFGVKNLELFTPNSAE